MGRRKISFDPAARFFVCAVLMVMKVSLCGPHSFEMSTLPPKFSEFVETPPSPGPFFARYVYLSHHVGSCALVPRAEEVTATPTAAEATTRGRNILRKVFMGVSPFAL